MPASDLRALIEDRLRAHPTVRNKSALARAADIQRDTLYDWFTGKTVPASYEMQKVAAALGVPVAELWNAYGGGQPVTPRTEEERRAQDAVLEAYRRGYREGWDDAMARRPVAGE